MGNEVRFAEVRRILEGRGCVSARIRGSHHLFIKPGKLPVSVPVHNGKVKSVHVRKIEKP